MMQIQTKEEINLLPPAAKRARVVMLYHKRASRLFIAAVLGVGIVLLTLGGTIFVQLYSKDIFSGQAADESQQADGIEQRVRSINQILEAVQSRIGDSRMWTERVEEIVKAAPEGISITALVAQGEPPAFKVEGRTSSRAAVVGYQRALEDLEWVQRVGAPLQNYAGGQLISFSLTLFQE